MLSNDLHLRLHNRDTYRSSGLVVVRRVPTVANGTPFWIRDTPRTEEKQASVAWVPSRDIPEAIVAENEIEAQWIALLRLWPNPEELPGCPPSPRALIEAAMERPELRSLFPFTRAYTLCFRQCPNSPQANTLPTAAPIDRDYYQAFAPGSCYPLCEGSAQEVVGRMAEMVGKSS